MKLLTMFSAILFIFFCTSTSSANIYSWTDENGTTHFTNYSPPPGAKMVVKDIPIPRRMVSEKESAEKEDLLEEKSDIDHDLEEGKIPPIGEEDMETGEALREEPYYSTLTRGRVSKNRFRSKYPPGFRSKRFSPELDRLKHRPNYHYKLHLDKPHFKKSPSAFHNKRHFNKPTIWDRSPRFHKKRVFGWQPFKAKARPSAHRFAFGKGHFRGTSFKAKGRFGGRGSALGAKGRFGGRGSAFGGRGRSGGGRSGR